MDDRFSSLIPCDPSAPLEEIKEARETRLVSFFREFKPEVLVTELYPFGRKAFRFELEPLIEAAASSPCRIVCSLRDILVEKKVGQQKHDRRAVKTLNRFFDALVVHSDPRIVTLNETFELFELIRIPIHYTGFITPLPRHNSRRTLRKSLGLGPEERLIVTSIGSGSVGSELLQAVCDTARIMVEGSPYHFHLFSGPYCPDSVFDTLSKVAHDRIVVDRFTDNFVDWLAAADLSISMAGYNTSMNILAAGVPALMMPFEQNREQRLRIEKLAHGHPIRLLDGNELHTDRMIPAVEQQLAKPRYRTTINLDGAAHTADYLKTLA
jgi:predicted glycosyltransferase